MVGVIDFVQPDEQKENEDINNEVREEVAKLNKNISEIRSLENKTKMLEYRNREKNI
jgi:hypothetical protein